MESVLTEQKTALERKRGQREREEKIFAVWERRVLQHGSNK